MLESATKRRYQSVDEVLKVGAENTADGSASVPEPSLILGNIMAVILMGVYVAGMRRKGLKSVVPRNSLHSALAVSQFYPPQPSPNSRGGN